MEAAGALRAAALILESIPNPHGGRVCPRGSVVVIRTPVRPNSNSAESRAWLVLNYSSYVVLGLNWL